MISIETLREDLIKKVLKEGYILVNGKTHIKEREAVEELEREGYLTCTRSRFEGEHIAFVARATNKLRKRDAPSN